MIDKGYTVSNSFCVDSIMSITKLMRKYAELKL